MGVTNDAALAYHIFDIFILPSLYEGFPVTLIEAQLSGVYSLTSDNVSNECDLGIGMLEFLPLDIVVWKQEIIKGIKIGSKRRNKISEISDGFDVNIQWKKLYEIYKKNKS